jgi:hypothetical protein
LDSIHLDEHFVKVPFRSEPNSLLPQPSGVNGAELLAPFPDRFIRHWDAPLRHHLFNIPIAQGKAKVQPYALLHNLDWETVPTIYALRHFHNASFSHFLKLTVPASWLWELFVFRGAIAPLVGDALFLACWTRTSRRRKFWQCNS